MVTLSVGGVLVGLVPPLALGLLVDALLERNDKPEAVVLTVVMALAVLLEAGAYILSDGMYARNSSRLYRNIRVQMFAGAQHRASHGEETSGVSSRFISDVETLEGITMVLIDSGSMALVGFATALLAVVFLQPWSVAVILPALGGIWIVTRRMQEPAASAGQHRQEELEAMTDTLSRELDGSDDPEAAERFRSSTERLLVAEVKLGWLQALNLQGSGGLAKLGPIAVVVIAAFMGTQYVGTLISLYLLAQRVFWSFDGLVDLSLGMNSVRGPVARCFELIDAKAAEPKTPALVGR
jgi:ABC-type bacteriocin/lantibiotic exporter with double-glycine peptidase domain